MFCKACNTRLGDRDRVCPNCGRARTSLVSVKKKTSKPALSPSSARDEDVDIDLELEEVAEETPTPAKGERAAATPNAELRDDMDFSSMFRLEPDQLRGLLAEQPELLEAGLEVYADDAGEPVGVDFATDVGVIDLLAECKRSLVVVVVAELDAGAELVSQVLQRVGWVRKHLVKGAKDVRAIVLLDSVPEELAYATAALGDTVALKTYRVALSFEDAEA